MADSTTAQKIADLFDHAKREALALLCKEDSTQTVAAQSDDGEGVTVIEAAHMIGVKKWRVYEMIRRGILPTYKPSPRTLRIRRGAVREFIATGRCTIVEQESRAHIHALPSISAKETQNAWSQQTLQKRSERKGGGVAQAR